MPTKSFSLSAGLTVNTGNYESARVDASVTYEVGADETLPAALLVARSDLALALVMLAEPIINAHDLPPVRRQRIYAAISASANDAAANDES